MSEFPDPEQDWEHALLMRKSTRAMFHVRPDDAGRPHDDGICYCADCLEHSRDELLFLLVPEPPKDGEKP